MDKTDSFSMLRVFSFHFRATRPPLPPAERLPVYRRIHDLDLLDALVREAEWPLPTLPSDLRPLPLQLPTAGPHRPPPYRPGPGFNPKQMRLRVFFFTRSVHVRLEKGF